MARKVEAGDRALGGGDDREVLSGIVDSCQQVIEFFWTPNTSSRHARLVAALEETSMSYDEAGIQIRMLREAIEDDLKNVLVLYMASGQAIHYYAGDLLLGEEVRDRFPQLAEDIDEAGKCLGAGRTTAAVFHLMRIMETGVQEIGTALGVVLVDAHNVEKNWHNIVEESDKAIKSIAKGDPRKAPLSEASAFLSAVKIAWRNEVMHPKASYSAEEAEAVLHATKAFMRHLALIV